MLTDAILREATAEAERFRLSLVPEDGEPHEFSKRFRRKMEKLIRRANHPIRYQVMRTAAAVALVIVTLFGAVMAVSPEARAAVIGWIKETFGVYVQYSNDDVYGNKGADSNNDIPKVTKAEYHLAVVPDGYRKMNVIDKIDGKIYVYANDHGEIIQFTYSHGTKNDSLFIKTENYEKYPDFVDALQADIYLATNENEPSIIVWQDPNAGVLFHIFAMMDRVELINIAETVEKISP